MNKYLFPTFFVVFLISSCVSDKLEITAPIATVDTTIVTVDTSSSDTCKFTSVIQPIITTNCAFTGCHVSGFGSGDFSNYSGLKAKVDDGKLELRVLVDKDMPPSGPLSQTDRDKIQCWINNGAPNN